MFCNQCEQTAKGEGCTQIGVCGKSGDVAALQDLLTYAVQGLSLVAVEARKSNIVEKKVDTFSLQAIFACLTNVDFDPLRFQNWIATTVTLREELKAKVASTEERFWQFRYDLAMIGGADHGAAKAYADKFEAGTL